MVQGTRKTPLTYNKQKNENRTQYKFAENIKKYIQKTFSVIEVD